MTENVGPISKKKGGKRRAAEMRFKTAFAILLVFLFWTLPAFADQAAITDLGTLGGASSGATAINDAGQVVGWSNLSSSGGFDAFFWDPAGPTITDLGNLGGNESNAVAIDASGQVTGWGNDPTGFLQFAFFYDPTVGLPITNLGTLGGNSSYPTGMNDSGQVVGWSYVSPGIQHAFFWDPTVGTMVDLGTLGGDYSYANAINTNGQVVGWADDPSDFQHAFFYDPTVGTMVDLGTLLGGSQSGATALNDSAQVVGTSDFDTSGDYHAFFYDPTVGTMVDLGTLGGGKSYPTAINNNGQVVGWSDSSSGFSHAFFYDTTVGTMTDVGTFGGNESNAIAINDSGQVVGWADDANGDQLAFEWTSTGGLTNLGTLPGGSQSYATAINSLGQIAGQSYVQSAPSNVQHAVLWTVTAGPIDTLTVDSSNPSSGASIMVSPNDTGGNSNGTTQFTRTYSEGATVTLTASATAGSNTFMSWSGCDSVTGTQCTVNMTASRSVTANYGTTYTLTVDSSNPSSGVSIMVSPNDTGGNGDGTTQFTRTYGANTTVTLTASATAGSNAFSSWSGCDSVTGTQCTVKMTAIKTVTANYTSVTYTLTVASSNPSSGVSIMVSPNDTGGNGNGTTQFTRTYGANSTVTLTASAMAGSNTFSNWSGCDSATGTQCTVNMTAIKTVTANYTTISKTFSIAGKVSTTAFRASVKGVTITLTGPVTATVTTSGKGTFTFKRVPSGAYQVTPTKTGHTFTPPFLDVTVSGSNQAGVNFTEN